MCVGGGRGAGGLVLVMLKKPGSCLEGGGDQKDRNTCTCNDVGLVQANKVTIFC